MKFMLLGTLIVLGCLMAQAQADDDQDITRLPSASVNVTLSPTVCLPPGPIGGLPPNPIGGCTTVCIPSNPIGGVPPNPIGGCPAFFKNNGQGMAITVNGVPYAGVARVFPTGRSALGYSCSDAIVVTWAKNAAGNTALYSEHWECTEWSSGNELLGTWTPEAGILVVYPPNPIGG